ncbi:MAG TPA: hypothetical protein DDY68_00950 [Porphyromonadaceae bacterium]|nr:hypothetical protein [Porphyromonadaceae bacterium]
MDVIIKSDEGRTYVSIDGRVDTVSVKEFNKKVEPLKEGENPNIVIDCTRLSYVSSSGLRAFLTLQKSVLSRGGKMVLTALQPYVKEVFDITGFSSIFTIEETAK